ncbi:hypothetical protein FRB94_004893, partial [Tulasnella sp. JGI-2019a]
ELVVAALACKAWLGPAVDTKWTTKNIPFSRLLEKLDPIRMRKYGHTSCVPTSPITQDHWRHFLEQYVNRITRLDFDMAPDNIELLLKRFGGQFGTNLVSSSWSYIVLDTDYFWAVHDLFPGTKLREVIFPARYNSKRSLSVSLSRLAHCSRISRLKVSDGSFDFSAFPRLQYLSYGGNLTASHYHNLTHCPHLKILHLGTSRSPITSVPQKARTTTIFPHLEEFQLDGPDNAVEHMVSLSAMPSLRSLHYHRSYAIGSLTVPLLNSILQTSPHLETITIVASVPPSRLELVHHDGLRSLSFNNRDGPMDLPTIYRAFPNLVNLVALPGHSAECIMDWGILPILADHLHHLQDLTLSLHVSTSSLSEPPKGTTQLRTLTTLRFRSLHIRSLDTETFFSYLVILCPNIHNMEIDFPRETPEDWAPGSGPAFVKRFFDYKG